MRFFDTTMSDKFEPVYIKTHETGALKEKINRAYFLMESCKLCGRYCNVNRLKGEPGFCKMGKDPYISSFGPHHGEESPLVGRLGSGTIFLTGCNLGCIYCQNYDISILGEGSKYTIEKLALTIAYIQSLGCHNINFVTPTHQMPMILSAVSIAIEHGLNVPIVWNCGGYESMETLEILDGVVDIYMPDFKYWDNDPAQKYSNAPDYPEVARNALKEMHRQVGDLVVDERGIAQRGLLVRHLVLPDGLSGTKDFVKWLARDISPDTYINVMAQYHPCFKAHNFPEIDRRITGNEYRQARMCAVDEGLRLDK